jgi:hypothetical protein
MNDINMINDRYIYVTHSFLLFERCGINENCGYVLTGSELRNYIT